MGGRRVLTLQLLQGVGLVIEGEWQVLVLTLCPTGRRAMLLHPSLTPSHSLA